MINLNSSCFKNRICERCIKRNKKKYPTGWEIDCRGITVDEDVRFAIKNGIDEHQANMLFNPIYWFSYIYGSSPRHYQEELLCCTSRKLTARWSRQTGKSLTAIGRCLNYVTTNENVSVLIVAPQETQIKKLWDEYIWRDFLHKSPELKASVVSKTMSPNYQIVFDNNSRIILQIAGPGVRGSTANWLMIDEAAIIGKDILSDILMVIASKGDEASLLMTSTPKAKDMFYKACMEDPEFNELHVQIYDVDEMKDQVEFYKKLLSADGFMQECEALFLPSSGGPFNLIGVSLAKSQYEYSDCSPEPGFLYFGGVDWNGPNVGTYFYIVGFNPDTGQIKGVDKKIVSSAVWNSTVAKQTFVELNRKWKPKQWMVDYGYSASLVEDLKLWSLKSEREGLVPHNHPDAMVKHILEPVQFGGWVEVDDPFTREPIKKTTRGFMVSEVSKLFEPQFDNTYVPISFPASDSDLIESLESYKIINTTSKGTEQYGFEKGSGIEDHLQDAFNLSIYGIVKHYSELFKKILAESVPIYREEVYPDPIETDTLSMHNSQSIILLTDNSPEPIALDSKCSSKWEPKDQEDLLPIVSRTFDKGLNKKYTSKNNFNRGYVIKRTSF
jgi:hypothetical protein